LKKPVVSDRRLFYFSDLILAGARWSCLTRSRRCRLMRARA
jgi:hypothetical protein